MPGEGTNIFTRMTQLAQKEGAINLSQGFPDFEPPRRLLELTYFYMKEGYNQYAPMMGVLPLRERIAKWVGERYHFACDAEEEVTITSGATEALYAALTALVEAGDEVLLFAPAYDSYEPVVRLNGGVPRYVFLEPPDFAIPWTEVEKAVSRKTKLLVLNTPHNPTGGIWSEEDMEHLTHLLRKHPHLFVLSDEVYEHIVFDGALHQSVLAYPEIRKKAIAVFSFGKTFHITGWKVGYAIAPPSLTHKLRLAHQYLTFSTSTPFQYALADMLEDKDFLSSLPSFFQKKRDFFQKGLLSTRFQPLPCKGTYFLLASYHNISKEKDEEFAIRLTCEHKVAAIPLSVFYPDKRDYHLLRFCFAKKENTLKKALEKLEAV